jgi:hypothetical protein
MHEVVILHRAGRDPQPCQFKSDGRRARQYISTNSMPTLYLQSKDPVGAQLRAQTGQVRRLDADGPTQSHACLLEIGYIQTNTGGDLVQAIPADTHTCTRVQWSIKNESDEGESYAWKETQSTRVTSCTEYIPCGAGCND